MELLFIFLGIFPKKVNFISDYSYRSLDKFSECLETIKMARTKSPERQKLLTFLEVKNAIKMSFGAKKGSSNPESNPTAFQHHEDRILSGIELLAEYLEMNPYQIVEFGRRAQSDSAVMADAINKMDAFLDWMTTRVTAKGRKYTKGTAVTIRGNAMSLFKWNGIRIPTKNGDNLSGKKKRDQELGIDNGDKMTILKSMLYNADPEMKAFLGAGLACGHRISDMVQIEKKIIECWLAKDKDYIIYRAIDKKEGALIKAVFGPAQQKYLKYFLASKGSKKLGDDRVYLFGDNANTDARLRDNLEYLLHSVYDGDANIITPHTLRSMCETILTNHKYTKTQVYQFTGHKDGEKYIELTDEQMITMFQAAESDFNLDDNNTSMQTKEEIKQEAKAELLDELLDQARNRGKRETLTALYSEVNDNPDAEQPDADKTIEMKMAMFLTELKESFYSEFITRIKKDLKLK